MHKKIYAFCLALSIICFIPRSHAQQGKSEIAMGYGYFSVYSFVNHSMNGNKANSSVGVSGFTYRYYLTRNLTIGLGGGYETMSNWGTFFTVAPEVTFAYLDTRDRVRVRLYGAASYGVAIFQNNTLQPGEADNSGVWAYGFQATPIGVRVGRQFAGFLELGMGYKGIFHGGIELRFPHTLHKHMAAAESK